MITRAPRISNVNRNKLIKYFALDLPASKVGNSYQKKGDRRVKIKGLVNVNRQTVNLWYRHFREVIYQASRTAPRLFGEVEMDQGEFGGRGRKRMQALLKQFAKTLPHSEYMEKAKLIRKDHKMLVFGILQRGGPVYCHIIKRADAATLVPIVRLVVEDTATVYTDRWRGFTDLKLDGYKHFSINHSEEYVDKKGRHLNGIESFWSFAKRRLEKFNGISRTTLPLHIKECEFRYNNKDVATALKKLL